MSSNSSRRSFVKVLLGGAAAGLLLPRALRGANGPHASVRHSTFVMGQVATITAYGLSEAALNEAITDAFNALRRVDALMSVFSETSDIGKINTSAGREEIVADPWTVDVLRQAIAFAERTHGAFDPTVEPLMRAWGFRSPRTSMPTDREIVTALDGVGTQHVKLSNDRIGLDRNSSLIDLGGIGVGFAIDRAVERMLAHGVPCALIDVSGDLYAIGAPPDSDGWRIGIVDPMHTASMITTCTIRDQALCTSGNYESFVEYNAIKFGHVLNVRDGYPAHAFASATVIAPTATAADALSKPAFINPLFTCSEGKIIRVMNSGELDVSGEGNKG